MGDTVHRYRNAHIGRYKLEGTHTSIFTCGRFSLRTTTNTRKKNGKLRILLNIMRAALTASRYEAKLLVASSQSIEYESEK